MKRWYVAHTLPRAEDLALTHLQAQGFAAFMPRYHRMRRHARKTDVVIAPLFPRYIFVELDLEAERWVSVNSTRGIAYLVRLNGCPLAVPEGVIEELKLRADIQEIVPLSSLEIFVRGTKLEVQEGPFNGYVGVFEKMTEGDRVQVLLSLLGRPVKVNVALHAVKAVA